MIKVTISYAQSLDGRIATSSGESKYISCPEALELQQELRRDNDAVAVGIGTALADDPRLTCKITGSRNPIRVVFDSTLSLPPDSRLAGTARDIPTICVATTAKPGSEAEFGERRERLSGLGVVVLLAERGEDDRVDIASALDALEKQGIGSLFVEGGSALITSFLRARRVDTLLVDIAPIIIGEGKSAIGDLGISRMAEVLKPKKQELSTRGIDLVWRLEF